MKHEAIAALVNSRLQDLEDHKDGQAEASELTESIATLDKQTHIWLSVCGDVFGGYGLTATGHTEEHAEEALWEQYQKTSPTWNEISTPHLETLEQLRNEWGVFTRKLEVGKGYFGDGDAIDHYQNETAAKQKGN